MAWDIAQQYKHLLGKYKVLSLMPDTGRKKKEKCKIENIPDFCVTNRTVTGRLPLFF